jgi:predicted Zn-dependent protease
VAIRVDSLDRALRPRRQAPDFTGGASLSNEAVARLAAHLATSAYTRDLETEADDGAVAMLEASSIGSDGLTRFFRSIERRQGAGSDLPAYLSSHPRTEDRIAAIEKRKARATAPALSNADWKALRSICNGASR